MAGVHEPLERVRAAVGLVHGPQPDPVVAPAVLAGERGERHQLHDGDAERRQVVEPSDRGVERPLRGERADVQLVDHRAAHRRPAPLGVAPAEGGVIVGPARPVRARKAGAASAGQDEGRRRQGGTRSQFPRAPAPPPPTSRPGPAPGPSRPPGRSPRRLPVRPWAPTRSARSSMSLDPPARGARRAAAASVRTTARHRPGARRRSAGPPRSPPGNRSAVSRQPPARRSQTGSRVTTVTARPPRRKAVTCAAAGPGRGQRLVARGEPLGPGPPQPQRPGGDEQLRPAQVPQVAVCQVAARARVEAGIQIGERRTRACEAHRPPVIRVHQGQPGQLASLVDVGHSRHGELD